MPMLMPNRRVCQVYSSASPTACGVGWPWAMSALMAADKVLFAPKNASFKRGVVSVRSSPSLENS